MSAFLSRPIKTLENLCVDTVVKNFEKYCDAYFSEDSQIPKRHFEFLQRIYTKTLQIKLWKQKDVNEKYLDFLINKHSKEFELECFDSYNWSLLEERVLSIAETLVKLRLAGLTESSEKIIRHAPNLEVLDLSDTTCSDDTLSLIKEHCKVLKELDVSECSNVTDEGLKNLFQADTNSLNNILLRLDLENTLVSVKGVAFVLENVSSLESLNHHECVPQVLFTINKNCINEPDLVTIGHKTYNLSKLDFSCYDAPSVTESLSLCAKLCPHVKNLTVTLMTSDDLEICREFSKLESISLSADNSILFDSSNISINSFLEEKGMGLRNVDLTGFSFSAPLLKKYCPKLETLNLKDTAFDEVGEVNTLQLNRLHSFMFEGANFSNENTFRSLLSILASSPNLEILQLPHSNFNDELVNMPVSSLRCISKLREIDLSYSNVQIPLLETIINSSPLLEKLNIQSCEYISTIDYIGLLQWSSMVKNNFEILWSELTTDFDEEDDFYDQSDYDFDDYDDEDDYYPDSDEFPNEYYPDPIFDF